MGYSKKLQNVLGVTSSIIAEVIYCNNAKDSQKSQNPHIVFVYIAQKSVRVCKLSFIASVFSL